MKQIKIRVIPNAKKSEIVEERDIFKVYISAAPVDGKANKALIELMADYFNTRKSAVKILKGERSREKIVGIENE